MVEAGETAAPNHYDCVNRLWSLGLRFGAVIDLGCADGLFSVLLAESGPTRGSVILNVDAHESYRESLSSIQQALGGHFRFCAVIERDGGFVELLQGEHPYWNSVRPADDPYWAKMHGLHAVKSLSVPARSLDSLVAETRLPAPYLLKLDIQGSEAAALAGGRATLQQTDVVVVEILIEDFAAIHQGLSDNDFVLFDLSSVSYSFDVLAWFYAVYVKSRHAALRPTRYWPADRTADAITLQARRRETVQNEIWASLDRYRAGEWPAVPR